MNAFILARNLSWICSICIMWLCCLTRIKKTWMCLWWWQFFYQDIYLGMLGRRMVCHIFFPVCPPFPCRYSFPKMSQAAVSLKVKSGEGKGSWRSHSGCLSKLWNLPQFFPVISEWDIIRDIIFEAVRHADLRTIILIHSIYSAH